MYPNVYPIALSLCEQLSSVLFGKVTTDGLPLMRCLARSCISTSSKMVALSAKRLNGTHAAWLALPKVIKYYGAAFLHGSILMIVANYLQVPGSAFVRMLYGADQIEFTFLSSIVTGTWPDSRHVIRSMCNCWRYLGTDINVKKHSSLCGQYPLDHPSVGKYAHFCTTNDLDSGAAAFEPHT
jgi:hypothetical protein